MHEDARTIEQGRVITSDICIVGAGAAGISLARQFIDTPYQVCLLESGGFEPDPDTQMLYRGRMTGVDDFAPGGSRLRFFGGTTNHWSGLCSVFDEHDFQERSWVPFSGWPIRKADLDSYYRTAQEVCQLGPFQYTDLSFWEDPSQNWERMPVSPSAIGHKMYQYSPPTRFGHVYRDELIGAENIRVLTYANATDIRTTADERAVTSIPVKCLNGNAFEVRARHYVLACGGLENPRLLLNATGTNPKGVGNTHNVVGRFFIQHPIVHSGMVALAGYRKSIALYRTIEAHGTRARAVLTVPVERQRQHKMLNFTASLKDYTPWYRTQEVPSNGYTSARSIYHSVRRGTFGSNDIDQSVVNVLEDFESLLRGVNSKLLGRPYTAPRLIGFQACIEQEPNPNSRITLYDERDELGLRRLSMNWQLTEQDRYTIRKGTEMFGQEIGRAGLGRMRLLNWLDEEGYWPEDLEGGYHHMGTTRMSSDPRQGVVNKHGTVHGIDNLHIAGSSVFTTAGCANPTLTIVALALRLADHLTTRLRHEPALSMSQMQAG